MTSDTIRQTLDELLLDKNGGSENEARAFFLSQIMDQLRLISSQTDAERQLKKLQILDPNDNVVQAPPPPPPPPPPIIQMKAPPPPPPPLLMGGGPPPPPPLLNLKCPKIPRIPDKKVGGAKECPTSFLPKKEKKTKTRTVQWSKINASTVQDDSVWGKLAKASDVDIDFDLLDNFFGIESMTPQVEVVKKKSSRKDAHVELLTSKRSQNVAIMLKQFKNVDEFIENVSTNRPVAEIDALQNLFGMLPQTEEEEALKRYSGDISLLSPPSSFFYRLVQIKFYRLRIETQIFLGDFSRLMRELAPNVEVLIKASKEILTSPTLPRLLLILVNMGNYLNSNNSQGNAFGFTLNSMWKLIDLKGNKQEFSLLHLLVTCDPDLVSSLQSELTSLKEAAQISFDEIKTSLKTLKDSRLKLEKQLEKCSQDEQFTQFLELIKIDCCFELKEFDGKYELLCGLQGQLADYFCENRHTFQLDECLKIFTFLLNRLHQTLKEHVSRENRKQRKEEKKGETEIQIEEKKKVAPPKNGDLFETLTANGTPCELTRKRASDILDVRQKLGNVRIRKLRDVTTVESFSPPPLESPTDSSGSSKENEEKTKTSTNYEMCNDLESYISSLTKKRASHIQKEQSKEEKKPEPPKPELKIEKVIEKPAEPLKTAQKIEKPPLKTPTKTLKPPTSIIRPKISTPSTTPEKVRIVSVTTSSPSSHSKLAELRKPGARSPPNKPVVPKVTVPPAQRPSGIQAPLSRRMSAPVVRKPTMTAEKKREVSDKGLSWFQDESLRLRLKFEDHHEALSLHLSPSQPNQHKLPPNRPFPSTQNECPGETETPANHSPYRNPPTADYKVSDSYLISFGQITQFFEVRETAGSNNESEKSVTSSESISIREEDEKKVVVYERKEIPMPLRRARDPANRTPLQTLPGTDRFCLAFGGCGFLGTYQFGAAKMLHDHGKRFLQRVDRFSGCSSGSLVSTMLIFNPDKIPEAVEEMYKTADELNEMTLGAMSPGYIIGDRLRKIVERFVPDDISKANDLLFVSVTRLKTWRNELISNFHSKKDLIDCLMASCYHPMYSSGLSGKAPILRGEAYIDGGYSNILPEFLDKRTVSCTAFAGDADICPAEKSALFNDWMFAFFNQNMKMTLTNISESSLLLWTLITPIIIIDEKTIVTSEEVEAQCLQRDQERRGN
uniref:FH2 domain-containing protein n=1 Tax=Caenorhabditis tropicalis TaxID=1561998 RepID=A0A1I7UXE0_9PELO